ncbi:unnamed protein product [Trifolium pratense]|uniref:Uncharacterized protein n=1 Tax=Trifolium pratense TaxID=57577 RepID=A0ACB0J898_TRIPR|nr:unnamed protein product [Trifolium pratense]
MAVATKPKDIALIDVPKLFHGPSSSTPPPPPVCECDGPGFEAVYTFHVFDLSPLKSLILFNLSCFCSNPNEKGRLPFIIQFYLFCMS